MFKRTSPKLSSTDASTLHEAARNIQAEQEATLDAAPVDQLYQETLASYIEGKQQQVASIEDKLEQLVDRQKDALQRLRANAPGALSRPSTRKAWQNAQASHAARLQQLSVRLNAVREIKEEMGLYAPKIEELATRKLRIENPGLAADWDFMRETERVRQALARGTKTNTKTSSLGLSIKPRNS